jgi:hypothetical protein
VAAETKQFFGPVPRKQHTLSHTSHNVRFKQTFLHFNVLAKKLFKKYEFAQNKEYFDKNFFTREVSQV